MKWFLVWICCWVVLGTSCNVTDAPVAALPNVEVPAHFPPIPYPEDNAYTPERWELGKMLFFDPVLSVDSSISCATCHAPKHAFTSALATTPGVAGRAGVRNVPTLANVAYYPYYLTEGGARTLELQILVPIAEHNEFDHSLQAIENKLKRFPRYAGKAELAYGRSMDAFVITRAIANYERTLISGHSAYDQFMEGNSGALSHTAQLGMDLFFSEELQCATCHAPPFFTDFSFQNNGLYTHYADSGRSRLTGDTADRALFKVPALRNIAVTAPYMHDGSLNSLAEVVAHYSMGGAQHVNKSKKVKPLGLSTAEQQQLVSFLECLTDSGFLNDF